MSSEHHTPLLCFSKLEINTLQLKVCSDTSFYDQKNSKSEIACKRLLTDDSSQFAVLQYAPLKSDRVVRFRMAAEILALAADFDHAYIIWHDLQRMLGKPVPLQCSQKIKRVLVFQLGHDIREKDE